MGYQSEAELEERLMQKLESQGYERIKLADYDALVENFRRELNKLNQSTLDHELTDSEFKRVLNTIDSKSIYSSAKQLRDHFTLELDDGGEIYMRLFSSEPEKNHFQVSNQITVVGKYVNRYDVTILANGLQDSNATEKSIAFQDYILMRIISYKNGKLSSDTILYDTLYRDSGIERPSVPKDLKRDRDVVKKIMEELQRKD